MEQRLQRRLHMLLSQHRADLFNTVEHLRNPYRGHLDFFLHLVERGQETLSSQRMTDTHLIDSCLKICHSDSHITELLLMLLMRHSDPLHRYTPILPHQPCQSHFAHGQDRVCFGI